MKQQTIDSLSCPAPFPPSVPCGRFLQFNPALIGLPAAIDAALGPLQAQSVDVFRFKHNQLMLLLLLLFSSLCCHDHWCCGCCC